MTVLDLLIVLAAIVIAIATRAPTPYILLGTVCLMLLARIAKGERL
jgi:hypothetical protein